MKGNYETEKLANKRLKAKLAHGERLSFCPMIRTSCNRECIFFEKEYVYKIEELFYISLPICLNLKFTGESIVLKYKN